MFAHRSGEAVIEMLRKGIRARDIMTKEAFEKRYCRHDGLRRFNQCSVAPIGHC